MTVRTSDSYFTSVQYNWTGEYDAQGSKIPGDTPECYVRGIHHPQDSEDTHKDPFSIIDFTVFAGKEFNPVRFSTIHNTAYISSGVGQFIIFNETGTETKEIKPSDSISIPPLTKYSFKNTGTEELRGVMVSSPAWFQEDEEYEWALVKHTPPQR